MSAQILAFVEEKDLSLKSMQPSDLEEFIPKQIIYPQKITLYEKLNIYQMN